MNKNKSSHETLIGVALLAGLVLIALVLSLIAGVEWYLNPPSKLSIVDRRNLVQGLASAGQALAVFLTGAVGLIGLFFTWQNTSQARESTKRTLELTEQGQVTERFTRAIEQLGNNRPEVRIGGIYALESIARDSEQHHWTIVEVVTAFVRTRTSESPEEGPKVVGDSKPVKDRTHQHGSADVQAALYVLANRNHALDDPREHKFINLSSTDLRNADLRDAHLEKARLRNTDLTGAILRHTNFQCAKLTKATLNRANLDPAYFEGADLGSAHLQKADLVGADLKGATLDEADLVGADLKGATLDEADLTRADLRSSNFEGADLRGAKLSDAKFGRAPDKDSTTVLREANLTGATGVDVSQLEASGVQLEDATMPDGRKYEDWRKDKEGSGKDVENE